MRVRERENEREREKGGGRKIAGRRRRGLVDWVLEMLLV